MTWKPKNDIAFVADKQEEEEVPFDDFLCQILVLIPGRWGDVLGTESNMHGVDVCEINAKRAAEEGQSSAARVWEVMAGLLYVEPKTVILEDEDTAYTPLTLSKEDTTVPQTLPVSMYDASISSVGICPFLPYTGGGALDDSDSESGSDNNDEDVNGSGSVGKAILSSPAKRRSSTSLTNLHASSNFSPSPCTTSYARRIPAQPAAPVRTSAGRYARADQAPVRSRKASCSFAKDHPTAISRAASVAMGNTTTKTKLRVGFWIGFWIRLGVRRTFASHITDTSIPHLLFNQTTCKHKKSQLIALELKGRPIANSRA
ncbi:hypothetical protein BU17DRAFT_60389 [Hysterangium stoloniferum]|nr:hypothetical protein BU17DRAFT_60389 [Hysterangium stoloniferum]